MVLAYGSEYHFAASRQLDLVAGDQSLFGFRHIALTTEVPRLIEANSSWKTSEDFASL